MNVNLANKHILITGGTGTLGRALVRRASEEGATVYFTYHTPSDIVQALETLGAKGFHVDLSKRGDIDRLKNEIKALTGTLDAMVHNAAMVKDRTIQSMTETEWDDVISVNLSSIYYLTKKFLSFLFKVPGSKILNVISRVGFQGAYGQANYAAAKGGLIALTKSLAQELGRKQIMVNALNPGFMKSKMTESIPEEIFERNLKESVLGQMSDPERVADFAVYLLSDRFQDVTGQVFHLDSRRT